MALLVEGEVVLVDEDRHELHRVLHADRHAVRVHQLREPSVVLDLLRLGHGNTDAALAVCLCGVED